MIDDLLKLTVLFLVIFDPLVSFSVFTVATADLDRKEKNIIAFSAILVAGLLSLLVLFLGMRLLGIFNTDLHEFRVASGIILGILGVRMSLGQSVTNLDTMKNNSSRAIAVIIGTPLLTGPAAITTIIMSTSDYGRLLTGLAVLISLTVTGLMLFFADRLSKIMGRTAIQIMSTFLGIITISWAVNFISTGIKGIFLHP